MKRLFLVHLVAFFAVLGPAHAQESALTEGQDSESTLVYTDDGMYTQSWFLNSFLELRDDLNEAVGEGKALVVIWEQKGCPYCEKLHTVTISDPKVRDFMRDNFNVVQLNKYGARIVTDFDGEELPERIMARKFRVAYTPTVQFFVADEPALEGGDVEIEALNVPGYLPPEQFYNLLEFVKDRRFRTQSLVSFLKDVEGTLER